MAGEGESLRETSVSERGREGGGGEGGEWGSPTLTVRILCGCCPFARLERRGVYMASTRSSRPPLSERAVRSVDVAPPLSGQYPESVARCAFEPPPTDSRHWPERGGRPPAYKVQYCRRKIHPIGRALFEPTLSEPPPRPQRPPSALAASRGRWPRFASPLRMKGAPALGAVGTVGGAPKGREDATGEGRRQTVRLVAVALGK